MMPLGERHLRRAITEFVEHYHLERNHQGLDNRLITGRPGPRASALAPGRTAELLRACCVISGLAEMWNSTRSRRDNEEFETHTYSVELSPSSIEQPILIGRGSTLAHR